MHAITRESGKGPSDVRATADAFVRAANRSRFIIIVLVVASTLGFTAFWNSQQHSWIQSRLLLANFAVQHNSAAINSIHELGYSHYRDVIDSTLTLKPVGIPDRELHYLSLESLEIAVEIFRDTTGLHFWQLGLDTLGPEMSRVYSESKNQLSKMKRAIELCRYRGYLTSSELATYRNEIDRLRAEYVLLLSVPVLGIVIDVNDLGFVGGFGLAVIMLWFRLSLSREQRGLQAVFKAARRQNSLHHHYIYVAIQQVLSVPPPVPDLEANGNLRLWNALHKSLFALPLVVHASILLHDLKTLWIGEMVNPVQANIALGISFIFFVLIVTFTIQAFYIAGSTDRDWFEAAVEIRHDHKQAATPSDSHPE